MEKAKVIRVIETITVRGKGDERDPCRLVKQYWDFKGILLAENDEREKNRNE